MRVLACLTTEHNLWLVGLAAVICSLGAWITVRLAMRTRADRAGSRAGWIFLGAVAAGSTTWCTHFVAMLAYDPGAPVTYLPGLTAVSLVVAILAGAGALWVTSTRAPGAAEIGGGLFGAGVVAMHYTGMAAFSADAVVAWDPAYVIASVIFAAGFGAAAFSVGARWNSPWRTLASAGLLILAIVSLHFTAMGALVVTPLAPTAAALTDDSARHILAIAVAGVGLLVLGTGAASSIIENQTRDLGQARLRSLVEGSVDGMVVARDGVIVTVNSAFETLSGRVREQIVGRAVAEFFEAPETLVDGALVRAALRRGTEPPVPVEVASRLDERRAKDGGVKVLAVRDLRPRLEQERHIAHLARHDSLTGLPNRASYLERLDETLASAEKGELVALLAIDLDRFKEVNDLHGHAAGDHVLKVISERIRGVLREGEFVARLGGDEFVALTRVIDHAGAHELAHRLEEQLAAPIALEHVTVACGGSIGIAVYPDDAETATTLMNNADLAMYRAKASIGSRICFYETSMDDAVRARRRMATELRDAIANKEFELHYQVQTSILTGEATGYEVLLRWRHPERGYVPPADFIPLAEESGLILAIGQWVLRRACEAAASWAEPHKIAVNLSAVQLGQPDLPRLVHQTLIDTGLSPSRLELEITETAMILDPARTTHTLRQIKALGVSIAMDDFGVGYSSLSTLRAFPFDKIKLDRSFMTEIDRSPQARAIIRAVLALGDSLDIAVIAEGVETAEQLAFLREEGCDQAQGYLLGRPGPSIGGPLVCALPPDPTRPVFEQKKSAG